MPRIEKANSGDEKVAARKIHCETGGRNHARVRRRRRGMAILAALKCMYECFPHITLPQYLIALEVRKAERDGTPHTLASLVKKLRMPFSTASRVPVVSPGGRQHRRDSLSEPPDGSPQKAAGDQPEEPPGRGAASGHASNARVLRRYRPAAPPRRGLTRPVETFRGARRSSRYSCCSEAPAGAQ